MANPAAADMYQDASNAKMPEARVNIVGVPDADPTGVADSAPAIQAAINGLPAAGGRVTLTEAGTYKVKTTVTLKSNTSLNCSPGVTIAMDGPAWVQNYPYQALHSAIQNQNLLATVITDENMAVDGCRFTQNFASPFNTHYISFRAARNIKITNNTFVADGAGDGVSFRLSDNTLTANNYMDGAANACWDHWEASTNNKVIDNYCMNAHLAGMYITGTGSAFNGNVTISGVTLTVNSLSYGYLRIGSVLTGVGITAGTTVTAYGTGTLSDPRGTYTVNNSQTVGPVAAAANTAEVSSGALIRGNYFHMASDGVAAIALNGKGQPASGANDNIVTGNYITGGGASPAIGVVLETASLRNIISNNVFVSSGVDASPAISEQAGSGGTPANNLFIGNIISGWTVSVASVAAMAMVGTGSVASNNTIRGGTYGACIRLYGTNQIASNNICDSGTGARISISGATTPTVVDLNPAIATIGLTTIGTAGTAAGSLCITSTGAVYKKTTAGSCL